MKITLYHNPRCSKSRQALSLLTERGADVEVIEYLRTPPDEQQLVGLLRRLDAGVRDIVRDGEPVYRELELDNRDVDDATLLRAVTENPILLQRPIAVAGNRAVVGRPPENVLDLLD